MFGALIISIVSWAVTALLSDRGHVAVITRRGGDVIDIKPKG